MLIALLINNRVHNIFDSPFLPIWPPYHDGTIPLLVDVTGKNIHERDKYDPLTGQFTPRSLQPQSEEWNGFFPLITWNEEEFKWFIDYRSPVQGKINSLLKEIESSDYMASKSIKLNIPFDELYPGEKEKYQQAVEELHRVEAFLEQLNPDGSIKEDQDDNNPA